MSATVISMMVRFGSLARRICQPRRATLEAMALIRKSASKKGKGGQFRVLHAYSTPTANTTDTPSLRLIGMCRFQIATRGMMSITTSERTLMMEAVTRRE
jgi:hypothetical protein